MVAFLVALAIAIVISIISYAITPKPKQPKPEAAKQADNPTAEAGKEIPVAFGTVTMKELNVMDFGEKSIRTYQVKA